jgi:hypothetical protein
MLKYDRSLRGGNKQWCQYCNVFVANDPNCIKIHNRQVTHQINVRKYGEAKQRERVSEEKKNAQIDRALEQIRARAEDPNPASHSEANGEKSDFDLARELYGDDLLKELTAPKECLDRTGTFHAIMKSLPGKIPNRERDSIPQLRD